MELEEIPCPLPGEYAHFCTLFIKDKNGYYYRLELDTNNTEKKLLPFSGDNNNAFLVALVMSCQTDKCTLFWIGPFHLLLKKHSSEIRSLCLM